MPGRVVELTCHPGHFDATLEGRDGSPADGQLQRRVDEYQRLGDPGFVEAIRRGGFVLVTAGALMATSAVRAAA
jgi:hypothetical protein